MTDSTRDFFETLSKILLRCWLLGFGLMLVSTVIFLVTGNMVREIHGSLFNITPHEIDLIIYCGLGLMKLFLLTLFVFPWIAIRLVLRSENE